MKTANNRSVRKPNNPAFAGLDAVIKRKLQNPDFRAAFAVVDKRIEELVTLSHESHSRHL